MAHIIRTAQGNVLDMGSLMSENEEVIAVGNRKVNARGDELGPGGKVVRTRNQIMEEHYKTPPTNPVNLTAAEVEARTKAAQMAISDVKDPDLTPEQIAKLKGKLAK